MTLLIWYQYGPDVALPAQVADHAAPVTGVATNTLVSVPMMAFDGDVVDGLVRR